MASIASPGTPYRRLVVASSCETVGGGFKLSGSLPDEPALRLGATEYRLALLFDGLRAGTRIRADAERDLGMRLTGAQIEAFAALLATHGLLEPGEVEPLPSPTIIEPPVARDAARFAAGAAMPSTVPGSLVGPGLMDGLLGVTLDRRARRRQMLAPMPAGLWAHFGALLNWPLAHGGALMAFIGLSLAAVFGVLHHDVEAMVSLAELLDPPRLLLLAVLGLLATQIFDTAARAAAVARFAGTEPRVGILRNSLGIPLLHVDTGGAAERVLRPQRLRIVGAGLTSMMALAVTGVALWLMLRQNQPLPAAYALGVALLAAVALFLRINPLARRDGYFLLAQHYGIADLREQAGAAWFSFFRRSWLGQQRAVARSTLLTYWVLIIAYLLFALYLLSRTAALLLDYFRGPAFAILLAVMGVIVSQTFRNSREGTNLDLGQAAGRPWYVRWAAVMVAVVCLGAIPYRYDPSGDFVVLPGDRADVTALIAGDVREVLVKEGDVVEAGQVIARLADDEERAQVAIAEAKFAQTRADLALARKGGKTEEVAVAQRAVETAQQRAQVTAQQAQRLGEAYRHKSVTAQEYERAKGVADVDQKSLLEAQSRLALVRSSADAERLQALEAQQQQAEASLTYARQQLEYTEIKAPIAGSVVSDKLKFARGSYLERGAPLAVIEDVQERIAEVNLPEAAIDQVQIGKPAWARVWAFPAASFDGSVRSIAPSAEAVPYGKIVRVQVLLAEPGRQLVPGMTGTAKISGFWYPAIVPFTRALLRFLLVEIWSWLP